MNILVKIKDFFFLAVDLVIRAFKKIRSQHTIIAVILSQLYLMFLTCCIVYIIFRIQKDYEIGTLQWLSEHIELTMLSCLLIFIICEILYLLTFLLYVPLFTVFPVTITAAVANIFKMQFRSEPVVFSDLLLLRESVNIADNYTIDYRQFLALPIKTFVVLLILTAFIKRVKLNWIKRGIFAVAAALIAVTSFYTLVKPEETVIEKNTHSSLWNLTTEYKNNGFILGFFKSFKRSLIFAPKNYNEKTVIQIANELGYTENSLTELSISGDELPNVIVIMNESYWDSDNLTGIALNQDPMQSVRELWSNSGGVSLLSSQSGGGTANVEYEFLTGKSLFYYPQSSVVYQQYITKKQWSLAWYFRELGYSTTAVHPYYDWFWRRNIVYPLLGFENIYFDKTMAYIDYKGQFISDMSLTNEIIHKYEKFSEGGEKPIFTFAVSMQNHGSYYDSRYPDREIRTKTPRDKETDAIVEVFCEGVRYASEALVALIEYFENTERPTYIIMFGDHAPTLAFDEQLYASNENFELYPQDYFNMYRTPLIIWTNNKSDNGKQMEDIANNMPENMTPYMLTDELFNITGLPKPGYIQMLANIRSHTEGVTNRFMLDRDGRRVFNDEESAEAVQVINEIMEKLGVCQYDATLGKNYVINEFAEFAK